VQVCELGIENMPCKACKLGQQGVATRDAL
jgi:hypothetical protein